MTRIRARFLFALLATAWFGLAQRGAPIPQQLTFTPYHSSGIYDVGETVGWTVTPGPVAPTYAYNAVVLKEGKLDLSSGKDKIEIPGDQPEMIYAAIEPYANLVAATSAPGAAAGSASPAPQAAPAGGPGRSSGSGYAGGNTGRNNGLYAVGAAVAPAKIGLSTPGERALRIRVDKKLKVTLILDLIHVLEKLWKPAYVFHRVGSLEADLWVLDRTLRIQSGEVGQVVKGIRQSITKRRLSGPKRKTLNAVANYLYRNRTRMRYHEYLAKGWPIASGPVEGACKNLIKIAWNAPACVGPSRWRMPSYNSGPSTSQETSIATGHSTSIRTSLERRSKVANGGVRSGPHGTRVANQSRRYRGTTWSSRAKRARVTS